MSGPDRLGMARVGSATAMSADVVGALARLRVLPVVTLDNPGDAGALADALIAGGLPGAEITLRTEGALAGLGALARRSDLLLGAGTVLTADDADRAIDAGAQFVVSPGVSEPVMRRCADRGVPAIPGVATASEVMTCLARGVRLMKLFPAAAIGGTAILDALAATFSHARFVPTGGISLATAADYLARPAVVAVGGSCMVPRHELLAGRFDRVREAAAETMRVLGPATCG